MLSTVTTCLELVGALVVIAGLAVLAFPLVGAGWVCIGVGALLLGLSALVEWRTPKPLPVPSGSDTA